MWPLSRTLTGYLVAVAIVFMVINAVAWGVGAARRHDIAVFSAGFILGALGMYIAAALYGYQRVP